MNPETENTLHALRSGEWCYCISPEISAILLDCEEKCFRLNSLKPSSTDERSGIIKSLFGRIGNRFTIHSPFHCDFGTNIRVGDNFIANYNLTILDETDVTIGDNVFIGPNVSIYTVTHALDISQRNDGLMQARPVTIGDNVWICGNCVILPGVTIGEGSVIGAGSVVTRDIPPHTLAVGNPCRPLRPITETDIIKDYYTDLF
ncbi:MAG: sugar O-acetyltransferase [Duncaniella sp.]|nr:sugar O-acetyltransferase [Duncaniella sp.]